MNREAILEEQLAEAEQQKRVIFAQMERLRSEMTSLEQEMYEVDVAIGFLRRYQAKYADEGNEANGEGRPGGGIRAMTQDFIRKHKEFTYDQLLDAIKLRMPDPNPNSIRAELSHNKRRGLIDRVKQGSYVSLITAPHHGTFEETVSDETPSAEPATDDVISLLKSTDWSKVPDGPPVGHNNIDESDPFADE